MQSTTQEHKADARRFSQSITLNTNYTFSKSIERELYVFLSNSELL
jgi:hypothetical protein